MDLCRLGVLIDRQAAEERWSYGLNAFELYAEEVLRSAGLPFIMLDDASQLERENCDIVLIALASEDARTAEHIWNAAARGATVIAFAGVNKLASRLGCQV